MFILIIAVVYFVLPALLLLFVAVLRVVDLLVFVVDDDVLENNSAPSPNAPLNIFPIFLKSFVFDEKFALKSEVFIFASKYEDFSPSRL